MSSPGQVAGATQQAAGETAGTVKDEAVQVGSSATAAVSDVAGTAKEQVGNVAGEAVSQVRDLLDQTRAQVAEQAGGAQHKLGESLRSLADELRSMGEGSGSGSGPAAELARAAAEKGTAFADYLGAKQPGELVTELRGLAARRPGGFLLGALLAGVAAGRLVRGATSAQAEQAAPEVPRPDPLTPHAVPVAPLPVYPGESHDAVAAGASPLPAHTVSTGTPADYAVVPVDPVLDPAPGSTSSYPARIRP